jgi:glycosyltransferase involved in cell wall biosynthesis
LVGSPLQVALIITTYNRPDALSLVLESAARQYRLADEVIICDDGSDSNTSAIIASWSSQLPIRHAWCPDMNFRAALTRNLGILKSQAEILIFVDGDCLAPPSFIESHLKLAEPGYVVSGGRHLLSDDQTKSILNGSLAPSEVFDNWKFASWPLGFLRDFSPKNWGSVRTCNLSVHREDALRIAGFDESYVGWGREDSDFVVRLIHSDAKIRSGRLAACVAHLYHSESPRDRLSVNDQRFRETLNKPKHVIATSSILYS